MQHFSFAGHGPFKVFFANTKDLLGVTSILWSFFEGVFSNNDKVSEWDWQLLRLAFSNFLQALSPFQAAAAFRLWQNCEVIYCQQFIRQICNFVLRHCVLKPGKFTPKVQTSTWWCIWDLEGCIWYWSWYIINIESCIFGMVYKVLEWSIWYLGLCIFNNSFLPEHQLLHINFAIG